MTNKIIARSTFALLALAFACNGSKLMVGSGPEGGEPEGGGPEPSTPNGNKPGQVWSGYVESYKFRSGSDRVTVTFDSTSSGTVVLGEPPAAGDVMDPNVAYPPDCNLSSMDLPPGEERHSFEQCAERFTFTMRSAIQEEGRLRFEVDIIDKWQSWCAAQTPYGSGWRTATVGDASTTTPNFSCGVPLPAEPSSGVVCSVCKVPEDGAGCPEADIVWVDCETRDLCSKACACTPTACSSRSDGQSHLRFDLNVQGNEAHGTSDLGQVHLVRQ